MFRKQFAEILNSSKELTAEDIKPFMEDKNELTVGEFGLIDRPGFDERVFAQKMSVRYGIEFIDLSKEEVPNSVISLMKKKQVLQFRAVPINHSDKKVTLCVFDPTVSKNVSELRLLFRKDIKLLITTISDWKSVFGRIQESVEELLKSVEEIGAASVEEKGSAGIDDIGQDVIQFVNKILVEAFCMKASDIHIEVYEKVFRIRMRVDGSLVEFESPSMLYQRPVTSRLKIMAGMDIAEKRLPQDGRIKLKLSGIPIDFRVSSLPTLFGEKIVLRLLDESSLQLDMTKLGFNKKQLEEFKEGIFQPYGMCLVVGPTGSGKTTTLYSAVSELNDPKKNIVTAEDPVEFNLVGVNQVNVKADIGLKFASALKSFLRQDPDIILVGEIRDIEVGQIAVEAALTGHLVLSTLHTNDAPSTITRLLNMGIEPFLLVASLNVIVAQRLCRKICLHCKKETAYSPEELVRIGFSEKVVKNIKIFKGEGCEKCSYAGYQGRIAIYEVLTVSQKIKDMIVEKASANKLKLQAIREGMKTLRMAALVKVAQGGTTVEEALKNSASDKDVLKVL